MRETLASSLGLAADSARLLEALTHPSYRNENADALDNQRLEFLGDAVLQLFSSALLFDKYPRAPEGQLTLLRSRLVSTEALARWAREQQLGGCLRLGRGAVASQLAENDGVLADAVEALLAAVFLERGVEPARALCSEVVEAGLRQAELDVKDPKSTLQERVQRLGAGTPSYRVVGAGGPDHDRTFTAEVWLGDATLATGVGRSKRAAERAAAEAALGLVDLDERAAERAQRRATEAEP